MAFTRRGRLTSPLLEHGLADEAALVACPVLPGRVKRRFAEGTEARALELVSTKAMPWGIIVSTCRVARPLKTGSRNLQEENLNAAEISPAVVLRDVVRADLPVLFEHQADVEAARLAAFTPRDLDAFMAHWARVLGNPSLYAKAIVVGNTVTGNIGVFGPADHREVGYWIGREHWGQGIATAAVREMLRLAAERPLYAHVAMHNAASIRVLEKCGFELLGEDPGFAREGESVRGLLFRIG